ncbi:inter-alpha-trypsin inhibitor heavy chain-like protein [Rhynchospora pubera]|uniref:Inter-alpha-trypsin inhibitor heavy chain-like protein n=1 Tax=Rhynchospora pubera TaxID=906938 RepID=A0AAV8FWD9_9POAL|nr:inter-alpha-trypsin inhibitor heavy chain-like protein [Rhynchospora pubera]
MMRFDDDEPIVLPPGPKPIVPGRVKLEIRNNEKVPMDDNTQKVLLTFTGEENSRSPLDIVAVLDLSGSMQGQRLEELKRTMLFVMAKLSPVDRLSIVTYSSNAKRLCPLRLVTPTSKREIEVSINSLCAYGGTNTEAGLRMGLDILNHRKCNRGRVGAIMLMSDGMQTHSDARNVEVGDVTVHTFGFGDEQDPVVLKAIADHSQGGTYSDLSLGNLSLGFAQCLGGLLSVVAQDLTLVLHLPDEQTCNYRSQVWIPSTTRLGDLCIKECRKVLMEVHLPRGLTDILKVSYTYKFDGEIFESDPLTISVQRTVEVTAAQQQTLPDVRAEDIRLRIVRIMKVATVDADSRNLESARDKLIRGIKSPTGFSKEEVGGSSSKQKEDVGALWAQLNGELKYDLRAQLEELLELMESQYIYERKGRAFAYSLLSSHSAQKPAGRGYNMEKFATPQMYDFLLEAAGLDVKS